MRFSLMGEVYLQGHSTKLNSHKQSVEQEQIPSKASKERHNLAERQREDSERSEGVVLILCKKPAQQATPVNPKTTCG